MDTKIEEFFSKHYLMAIFDITFCASYLFLVLLLFMKLIAPHLPKRFVKDLKYFWKTEIKCFVILVIFKILLTQKYLFLLPTFIIRIIIMRRQGIKTYIRLCIWVKSGLLEILAMRGRHPESEIFLSLERSLITKCTLRFWPVLQKVIVSIENEELCEQVVASLLRSKASILLKDLRIDKSALYTAISCKKWSIVNLILRHGCANSVKHKKFYQLCDCIAKDDEPGVKLFLDNVEDVDFKDMQEITPLRFAAAKNKSNFAKMLIDKGARVHSSILQEVVEDHLESQENYDDMIGILLKSGADPPFRYVCEFGDAKTTKLLLNYGVKHESNILMYAARNKKSTGPLEVLLKLGVFDANHRDDKGRTVLEGEIGSIPCTNACVLLKYGARIDEDCASRLRSSCSCRENQYCPVLEHFKKLKLLSYDASSNKLWPGTVESNSSTIFEYLNELEELKRIIICTQPHYSLFDLLFLKKVDLTKFAKNKIIKHVIHEAHEDFEEKFPHFGHILNRIVNELKKRKHLLNSARIAFLNVTGSCVPLILIDKIISQLDITELIQVCKINWKLNLKNECIINID